MRRRSVIPRRFLSQRPILLSFADKLLRSTARLELEKISNDRVVLVGGYEKPPMWMNMTAKECARRAFLKLASLNAVVAAARGKSTSIRPVIAA